MSIGSMPSDWKKAYVTSIFKKGSASDPSNYRPISQTSIFSKLMERVTVVDIIEYLLNNGLLGTSQHGFLPKRSTLTNLIECIDDWTLCIDNKKLQSVIYIDFCKAFDSVSRPKLVAKLKSYGITGNLLDIINDFLSGRSQRTRVGNCFSSTVYLSSGIVQGSCLGPLLFLIYINDILTIFGDSVVSKLYADDLKLYTVIDSTHDDALLQTALDRLYEWADAWQLKISIKKCQHLIIGNRAGLANTQHLSVYSVGRRASRALGQLLTSEI